ncbi:MAG: hypothetical protein H3C34_05755 [Caldilineaceae bacterium]|nr:hypothetical protein [Caldilineaceae bacterium]
MKLRVALLLSFVLVLIAFVPASADQPVLWYENDWDVTFDLVNCGSFTVLDRAVGHDSEYLYYDKDGKVVKTLYENRGVDNLFSSANPDVVVSGPYRFLVHAKVTAYDVNGDVTNVTRRWTGNIWNIQLPGKGGVYHESGQIVELFDVVNWTVIAEIKRVGLTVFDNQALCEYFAD